MTAETFRRRVDRLEAGTSAGARVTITRTGDREDVWCARDGRPPVRVKTLRGVSMEDL